MKVLPLCAGEVCRCWSWWGFLVPESGEGGDVPVQERLSLCFYESRHWSADTSRPYHTRFSWSVLFVWWNSKFSEYLDLNFLNINYAYIWKRKLICFTYYQFCIPTQSINTLLWWYSLSCQNPLFLSQSQRKHSQLSQTQSVNWYLVPSSLIESTCLASLRDAYSEPLPAQLWR